MIHSRRLSFFLSLLALLFVVQESVTAQSNGFGDECFGGMLYYVAYPDTTTNLQDSRFPDEEAEDFVLLIYSPVDQQVRIGRVGGAGLSVALQAGEMEEFDTKSVAPPIITTINQPERGKVLAVEAESPIILYAYMTSRFGAAGFTPLPVEAWGTEYFAAAWPGDVVRDISIGFTSDIETTPKPAPAFITIIAAYDNTEVSIEPTGKLAECNGCGSVTLNEGDAYQVHSLVDTAKSDLQEDIAGTRITSSKPIGVISGNTRTSIDPVAIDMLAGNSVLDLTAEWLSPIELHGRYFAFTPTQDKLRQDGRGDPQRAAENVRVISPDSARLTTNEPSGANGDPALDTIVAPDPFYNWRLKNLTEGRVLRTDRAAQAFQGINSVAEFFGTTGSGNNVGAAYNAWGSAMVELVPRERWGSFAPIRVPSLPSQTSHLINVVTDTNHRFDIVMRTENGDSLLVLFPEKIEGSDLIWGWVRVNPGTTYQLIGKNGATFSGHVYGLYEDGYELYRPGSPGEYEENVGQMYAMPLASSHCAVNRGPDEYEIEVSQKCGEMLVTIRALNDNPAGLKFIRLMNDLDSTFNALLEPVVPATFRELRESAISEVTVRIRAVDLKRDARGVLEFKDRTKEGRIQRVRFVWEGEQIAFDPGDFLDFGEVEIDKPAGERPVTIVNPMEKDVVVKGLGLALGNQNFTIVRTEPEFEWENPRDSLILKSGDTLRVFIDITPTEENRRYQDSLEVRLACVTRRLPIRATTVQPCLVIGDLAFGSLPVGQSKTLPLEICNTGTGTVRFTDRATNGEVDYLSWIVDEFDVSQKDIELLSRTELGPGDCILINVTFSSVEKGEFRTTARFWATTRECRDTSIWTASVGTVSVAGQGAAGSGLAITSMSPNPASHLIRLRYAGATSEVPEIEILGATGREQGVEVSHSGPGVAVIDASGLPSGLYWLRLRSGDGEVVHPVTIVR